MNTIDDALPDERRMTGGRALAEVVALHNPGPVFGMGGFQMLPFYEGLRALGMRHILVNDERAGAFAADAWSRVTGRPGLCDGTFGPGATNLATALAESLNAGVPIIAIVGEGTRDHAWKNLTQEARQREVLSPVCKEYCRIEAIQRIPEMVRRAYSLATSGRPGPVVIALPEDISHQVFTFPGDEFWADASTIAAPNTRARPEWSAVIAAAEALTRARRPLILAGGGVHLSRAYDELARVAELLDAPVAHTLSGKGAIACTDPHSVGLFGRYSRYANKLIDDADVLLVVGCKLGEIATKRYSLPPRGTAIIHLDSLAEEIGRWAKTSIRMWGDAKLGLADLAKRLEDTPTPDRSDLWAEVSASREAWALEAKPKSESDERPVHMARLLADINAILPADGILVADGGFASHWSGLLYDTKTAGRGFISDRGFASIGYGLPGSLGAALANPEAPVVGLTGDGGFNMVVGELETALRERIGFVLVVVNNAASGYVKALQHAMYGEGHYESSDLSDLDYARVARAYGCQGIRVEDPDEFGPALARAIATRDVPTVIDVVVTRDPARMLPSVDNRTLTVDAGDRPA